MHDRGDYKSGWEMERDWKAKEKEEKERKLSKHKQGVGSDEDIEEGGEEPDVEDDLPFACFLCRKPWDQESDPVVTKCQHYFCEHCALKHHAKNPRCFVCDTPTNGLFNVAHSIIKRRKAENVAKGAT